MTHTTLYCVSIEVLVTKDQKKAQALAEVLAETNIVARIDEDYVQG